MWVNGDYRNGVSAMDRLVARALETKKVADAMDGWLNELVVSAPVYNQRSVPVSASGVGLTEAPRGALAHWIQITGSKIARYQVVTPTSWNASPKDDFEQKGPIEQALIGTPVADASQPIEVLRIVHSFDPCLACTVH
jgi:hydrogenase large subunit